MWLQPPSFSIVAPKIELNENQINNLINKDKNFQINDLDKLIPIAQLPHFGHSLVLAEIQFDVSESSSHFLIHFLIK